MKTLLPPGWERPRGYANGIEVAAGRMIFLGGQIGWNERQEFESDDFVQQFRQTLENIVAILAVADATPADVVRMTWFVTDRKEYLDGLREIGRAWVDVMGRHYPAMSVVQVSALVEDRAKVEIEATAVV